MSSNWTPFVSILKSELIPALGCTEPAAAALAGAKARELLGEFPERVRISASRDLIKNAMGVGIPNSRLKGLQAAVVLGIIAGDASRLLNVLSSVLPRDESEAERIIGSGVVELTLRKEVPSVFIEVSLEGAKGTCSRVTISGRHDHFKTLEKNGMVLAADPSDVSFGAGPVDYSLLSFSSISDFVEQVPFPEIEFILESAETNFSVSRYSLDEKPELKVGPAALRMSGQSDELASLLGEAAAYAAAASEARMSGSSMPVIINSGSGNQGIAATVPLAVLARRLNSGRETLARALCYSSLVAIWLASHKDRLSALCGAFTASIGSACGMILLLGRGRKEASLVINTMASDLTGIVCDGAKVTCALKILSSLQAAAISVLLAMDGNGVPADCGIVGRTPEETVAHLERISREGMVVLDHTILDIMLSKKIS